MIDIQSKHKRHLKTLLIKRDGSTCLYCRKSLSFSDATLDHILPVSKAGTHRLTNLVLACQPCNGKRGNTDFEQWIKRYKFPRTIRTKLSKLVRTYRYLRVITEAQHHLADHSIPQHIIHQSYKRLKLNPNEHQNYPYHKLLPKHLRINFHTPQPRQKILSAFQSLTYHLDAWAWKLSAKELKRYV